mgnify:CR=1 FL=1
MENKRKDEFGKNVSVKNANLWYATRRTYKRRYPLFGYFYVYVFERVKITVPQIRVFYGYSAAERFVRFIFHLCFL